MISTFWFLIRLTFLIAFFMWVFTLSGSIQMEFGGYQFKSSLGVFLVGLGLIFWIISILWRSISFILNAPKNISLYHDKKSHKKGLQALSYGLSAVAAGDVKAAKYYAKRSSRFLTNDFGLSDLLNGLCARLGGDTKQANKSFQKLMEHRETSYLGLKGLLSTAMEKGDIRYARILAEKAYSQNKNQGWVIDALYKLRLKSKDYDQALSLIPLLKKEPSHAYSVSDEATLYLLTDNIKKAYRLNPLSLPIGLALLKKWAEDGKRRKSITLIKSLWAHNPNPKLLDYWILHAPKKTINNRHAMVAWIEDLHLQNSDNASSALYVGESILSLDQKEQAGRFLRQAIDTKPTIQTYRLMHKIDPLGGWTDYIANAIADKTWICTNSGKSYSEWMALSDYNNFNTIQWMYPNEVRQNHLQPCQSEFIPFFKA